MSCRSLSLVRSVNDYLIMVLERCGVGALYMLMAVTFIDVVGSKLFLAPVMGSLDMTMLAQLIAITCGTASTLVLGKHVRVQFLSLLLPHRLRRPIAVILLCLSLGLFVIMTVNLFVYGYLLQTSGEVSPTAKIPLFPFAYGAAFAFIPVCLNLLLDACDHFSAVGDRCEIQEIESKSDH